VNGLNVGRNSIGSSHKLSAQQVKEIQKRIAFIQSFGEFEEEKYPISNVSGFNPLF
jgi:hypothetical protein